MRETSIVINSHEVQKASATDAALRSKVLQAIVGSKRLDILDRQVRNKLSQLSGLLLVHLVPAWRALRCARTIYDLTIVCEITDGAFSYSCGRIRGQGTV